MFIPENLRKGQEFVQRSVAGLVMGRRLEKVARLGELLQNWKLELNYKKIAKRG